MERVKKANINYIVNEISIIIEEAICANNLTKEKFMDYCLKKMKEKKLQEQIDICKEYGIVEDDIVEAVRGERGNYLIELVMQHGKI